MAMIKVSVIVDTPGSWMNEHVGRLVELLKAKNCDVRLCRKHEDIAEGDIAVFLSCEKMVPQVVLRKNRHNLVVHESDLPAGKGWSPMTWQVLEGRNEIPITLFEATEKVDSGPIYYKDKINLDGNELVDGIRKKQADKTFELIAKFVDGYPHVAGKPQNGKESFYRRRTPADSRLDAEKSIGEQFNLLRVVDNERYPAFFYYRGKKYILKIYEDVNDEKNIDSRGPSR